MAGFPGFLHGAEVVETIIGPQPVPVNRGAVIGLVGTAPRWLASGAVGLWNPKTVYAVGASAIDSNGNVQQVVNQHTSGLTPPVWSTSLASPLSGDGNWQLVKLATGQFDINVPSLVSSGVDAGNYGPLCQGYTIPYALAAIQQQNLGGGIPQVVVVNVFNRNRYFSDLVEALTFNSIGAINLGHMGVSNLLVLPTTTTPVASEAHAFAGTPQTIQLLNLNIEHGTVVITPAAPADWAATHLYAQNAIIKPTVGNTGGFYFKATDVGGGTSGATEPATWNQTIGGTVTDGSVTWTNVGLSPYVEGTDYSVDYRTGLITALAGTLIANDESVEVAYSYYSGAPYINGTDFTADMVNGVVNIKSGGAIAANANVVASFSYADPTKVQDADIIGAVTNGVYTGIKALQTTYGTMGFFCSFLIAPGFSQNEDVASALDAMSQIIRSHELVDSAPLTAVAAAISNRGSAGQVFNTSSKRMLLCFPNCQFTDTGIIPTGITLSAFGTAVQAQANAPADSPLSQWAAGVWAATVLQYGFWASPSNQPIAGLLGPDVQMYINPFDPNADQNSLNAAGIVTVMNTFGSGLRLWGNRAASYPTSTAPDNFACVRHAMDQIEIQLQLLALNYVTGLDGPITNAHVMAILAAGNAYLRGLAQQGGLVGNPSVSFNPASNPAQQLANGQAVMSVDVMPPPPLERLTWDVEIDTTQLAALAQSINTAAAGSV